jgi:peptide/nickel transport system substrate-binding protein
VCRWFVTSRLIAGLMVAAVCTAHAHTRPRYGGTLHVETQGDPWQGADSMGRRLVFDSLVRTDGSGVVFPALAVRWQSQNSDHRWQFWLRPGVHFHDGSALTADSVLQSLTHSCIHCPWSAIRTVGDSIVITTASPDPTLPAELSRSSYAITRQDDSGNLSGTGAFRFVSQSNAVLTLAAVDDAWQGRPFLNTVEILGGRSVRNQWLDITSGRADVVEIPMEVLHEAQQQHLSIVESPACDLLALSVARTGALEEDAARESIALAVDRAVLNNVIFQKQGETTASLLPNALTGYSFLFSTELNLSRAQALRGSGGATVVTMTVEDTSAAVQLAEARIALNLREAGFHVQLVPRGTKPAPELILKRIHLETSDAQAALSEVLGAFNQSLTEPGNSPAILYRQEADFLRTHQAVPILYLPRAYGVGQRTQGLRLSPDATPLLGDVWLEGAR